MVVPYERKAEVKLIDFMVNFKSILTISQQNVASNAYNSYYHRRFFVRLWHRCWEWH